MVLVLANTNTTENTKKLNMYDHCKMYISQSGCRKMRRFGLRNQTGQSINNQNYTYITNKKIFTSYLLVV